MTAPTDADRIVTPCPTPLHAHTDDSQARDRTTWHVLGWASDGTAIGVPLHTADPGGPRPIPQPHRLVPTPVHGDVRVVDDSGWSVHPG